MSGNKTVFHNLQETSHQTVKLGDGKVLQVAGVGCIKLHQNGGKLSLLKNVQYVPQLTHNLLSVGQLMDNGFDVNFSRSECKITSLDDGALVACVQMTARRLFLLELTDMGFAQAVLSTEDVARLWHHRYGHLGDGRLQQLKDQNLVLGLPHVAPTKACESCSSGKQT